MPLKDVLTTGWTVEPHTVFLRLNLLEQNVLGGSWPPTEGMHHWIRKHNKGLFHG